MTPSEISKQAAVELTQTQKAFDQLEASMFDKIMATTVEETMTREKLFFAIQAIRSVKAALVAAASGQAIEDYTTLLEESGLIEPRP